MRPVRLERRLLRVLPAVLWPCLLLASGATPVAAQAPEGDSASAAAAGPTDIALGDVTVGTLARRGGSGEDGVLMSAHRLQLDRGQTVTLDARSYDFDAHLVVLDESGSLVAEDDNGGIAMHARLVVALDGGRAHQVIVTSRNGRTGSYRLEARPGEVPLPAGRDVQLELARLYDAWGRWEEEAIGADPARAEEHRANACQWRIAAGNLLVELREPAGAVPILERAVALAQPAAPGDASPGGAAAAVRATQLVDALARLGAAHARTGRHQEALAHLEPLLPQVAGLDLEPYVLDFLGQSLAVLGRHDEARDRFAAILDLAEARRDARLAVVALSKLADEQEALGDFEGARTSHERHVATCRADGSPAMIVRALVGAADFRSRRWRVDEARDLYVEALAVADHPRDRTAALGALGAMELHAGRFAESRRAFDQALALARESGDAFNESRARLHLAVLRLAMNDLPEAERGLTAIVSGTTEADDPEQLANAWLNLGIVRTAMDRPGQAEAAFARALDLARGRSDRLLEARIHVNEMTAFKAAGRLDRSREAEARALEIARSAGHVELQAAALVNRCERLLAEGEPGQARASVREALALLEGSGGSLVVIDAWESCASASLQLGEDTDVARAIELARERIDRTSTAGLGIEAASQVRSRFHRWSEVAQDWTALRLDRGEAGHQEGLVTEGWREAGRWKARSLLEGLAVRGDAGTAADADGLLREVDPADLRAVVLRDGDVYVDYVAGRDRLYAYVVTREEISHLDLGDRAEIDELARAFTEALSQRPHDDDLGDVSSRGHELHRRLVAPVLARCRTIPRRLIASPAPTLASLPFEALVVEPGATADQAVFVLDRHEVCYAPSAPVAVALAERGPRAQPGRRLVLADPLASAEIGPVLAATDARSVLQSLPRLPFTRMEGLALLDLDRAAGAEPPEDLAGRRSVALQRPDTDLYLGAEANASRLSGDLDRYSVIHVAAHGIVDAADPRRSGLVLSPGEGNDGFFSVAQVLDLRLDAEVAVLSACQTARGQVRRGEGVQSLAAAFLFAGARNVVASLWPVSDLETMVLMRRFYVGLLEEGRGPAEALQEAKRALRRGAPGAGRAVVGPTRERGAPVGAGSLPPPPAGGPAGPGAGASAATTAHPYFWAPFVCVGAPR